MLETERIKFEPLKLTYKKDLEKLFCENNLVMKSTLKGRVFTKNEFEEITKKDFISSKKDKLGFWCLKSKTQNEIIGVSGLHKFNYLDKEYYEFGFILNENYWKKGFATEIGNFWFEYAKQKMNITQLIATVSPKNNASRRVLQKLKMEYLGSFKSEQRGERLILIKNI